MQSHLVSCIINTHIKNELEVLLLATRNASLPTKKHVLAVCAKRMLANGYQNTTIKEIAEEAGVSVSSVQNFFGNFD